MSRIADLDFHAISSQIANATQDKLLDAVSSKKITPLERALIIEYISELRATKEITNQRAHAIAGSG